MRQSCSWLDYRNSELFLVARPTQSELILFLLGSETDETQQTNYPSRCAFEAYQKIHKTPNNFYTLSVYFATHVYVARVGCVNPLRCDTCIVHILRAFYTDVYFPNIPSAMSCLPILVRTR